MTLLLACLFLFAAQDKLPEYGTIADLKGLTKVYVSAPSTKQRNTIIKELKKSLTVVGSPDGAEFFIEYRVITDHRGIGATRFTTVEMIAYTERDKQRRIAWSKTAAPAFQAGEVSLPRDFIKALNKATAPH